MIIFKELVVFMIFLVIVVWLWMIKVWYEGIILINVFLDKLVWIFILNCLWFNNVLILFFDMGFVMSILNCFMNNFYIFWYIFIDIVNFMVFS